MSAQPEPRSTREALYCPGSGDTFRPYPCGRDSDHTSHDVGLPPGHLLEEFSLPRTPDVPAFGNTIRNVERRNRTIE